MLLREDRGEDVVGLLGCTLLLLLLLVELGALLDLLFVGGKGELLLLPLGSVHDDLSPVVSILALGGHTPVGWTEHNLVADLIDCR